MCYFIRCALLQLVCYSFLPLTLQAQDGYGNQWIFGQFSSPNPSGALLNFNNDTPVVVPFNKPMELEGSCAIMCDSAGQLLFYSNGCYIANANHQMMLNGGGIGKDKLETSFCNTGGNPLMQGMIALPKPGSTHLYYLFYTDIGDPYADTMGVYPLAPENMYYAVIDMTQGNGLGRVTEKNMTLVQDTLALGMMHANRHANGKDWWILMPESQSNCYWTTLLTENGIDTVFRQCSGVPWFRDPQGQAVFSPNSKKYVRFNYFHGLNIFDFDDSTGLITDPVTIDFGQDTFYFSGAALSSNSRFLYALCYTKIWQFDLWATDISASRILIGEINTPSNITTKTYFGKARLGPDGKIYVSGTGSFEHLHIIHRPNCLGAACDLEQYAIELNVSATHTLPNMPHYKKWLETDTCQTVSVVHPNTAQNALVRLSPNPAHQEVNLYVSQCDEAKIKIWNIAGQLVKDESLTPGATVHSFEVADWPAGAYIVAAYMNNEIPVLKKLIITH